MGHANLENISTFFVRRLYARGEMSIDQMVADLTSAGETVHASEGEYEDDGMLGVAVTQVVHYLTRPNPSREGYSGPQGGGPWIKPVLTAWFNKRKSVDRVTAAMLDEIDAGDENLDTLTFSAAADRIEAAGFLAWSVVLRRLQKTRQAYWEWAEDKNDDWDWDDENSMGKLFDSIPWRFAPGWRRRYRDVPILTNVSN